MSRPKRLPIVLTAAELDQLKAAAWASVDSARTPKQIRRAARDLVMVELGHLAGPRVAELCRLRVDDIDIPGRQIAIRCGKGRKDRNVPISENLAPLIEIWIGDRQAGWVFQGRGNGHLTPRAFRFRIAAMGKRAGIAKNVHPHQTRHAFATNLLRTGADLREIQELLGHSNLRTTETYLSVDVGRLKGAVDKL